MEPLAALGQRLMALREAQAYAPANIQPPQPQGYQGPMPNIGIDDFGYGRPGLRGDLTVPFAGGDVGISGAYRKPFDMPQFRAFLNYHRSF